MEHRGRAGDDVAAQEHVEGLARMHALELAGRDLDRMEQRAAQRRALGVDEARVRVQQPQLGPALELGHQPLEPLGHPGIVLVRQRDQRAAAGAHRLLEVLDHAQADGIDDDAQRDREAGPLAQAFLDGGAGHLDAGIARGVVGQHDLHRRPGLQADAADLLAHKRSPL